MGNLPRPHSHGGCRLGSSESRLFASALRGLLARFLTRPLGFSVTLRGRLRVRPFQTTRTRGGARAHFTEAETEHREVY